MVVADAHFLGIRSHTRLTAEVLEHAPALAAIGCFCSGTNQVELKAVQEMQKAKVDLFELFNKDASSVEPVGELWLRHFAKYMI